MRKKVEKTKQTPGLPVFSWWEACGWPAGSAPPGGQGFRRAHNPLLRRVPGRPCPSGHGGFLGSRGGSSAVGWLEAAGRGVCGRGRAPCPELPAPRRPADVHTGLQAWAGGSAPERQPQLGSPRRTGPLGASQPHHNPGSGELGAAQPRPREQEEVTKRGPLGQPGKGLGAGGQVALLPGGSGPGNSI